MKGVFFAVADLSGECRVAIGMVRTFELVAGGEGPDMDQGRADAVRFVARTGAASVLKALRLAGHEIGEEATIFLQDHEDECAMTVKAKKEREGSL